MLSNVEGKAQGEVRGASLSRRKGLKKDFAMRRRSGSIYLKAAIDAVVDIVTLGDVAKRILSEQEFRIQELGKYVTGE